MDGRGLGALVSWVGIRWELLDVECNESLNIVLVLILVTACSFHPYDSLSHMDNVIMFNLVPAFVVCCAIKGEDRLQTQPFKHKCLL